MDKYQFPTAPLADPEAVVSGPHYRFTLINDMVVRYEWSYDGAFEERASTFAINRRFPKPSFTVKETDHQLEIITPNYHLSYNKKRFSPSGLHVSFNFKASLWASDWRYGVPDDRNLGGTARTLDEVDGRCNMGLGILSKCGFAALDDSQSMLFDGRGFVAPRRPGDRIDGYLFCYGHNFKGAMKAFYAISGHQPRLPRWSLGNWWSRYHMYSADDYLALMDKFREHNTPLSVAVIDMDWHLVNDDRVPHAGWTGYTWNKELFPDPEAFGRALHEQGLKITLNDHPHSGVHHHEDLYEEMANALGHDPASKLPLLFDPTNQEFLNVWLGILHRRIERQACDFWWIDWQQGPYSRVQGLDPLWLLNHFHFLDNVQQQQKQNGDGGHEGSQQGLGLVFSRYAGPGSHRYPVGFSGDTIITWESLQFQPEFTATASNIGYGWWSHDIGGHMQGYRDDELAARWVQLGVFSPVLRLHSSESSWSSKEPWLYRDEFAASMRSALQLRHRLVPYLYSMNIRSASACEPIVQPLYWAFPTRKEAYEYPNQYYFGTSLVVMPIVHPRDRRTNRGRVKVWVPAGRHVDILTGCVYDGDREIDMYRPISGIPVLAPEGSIVPLDDEPVLANGCPNPNTINVLVVVGRDGRFSIVEDPRDDGEDGKTVAADKQSAGKDRSIEVGFEQGTGQLKVDDAAGKRWNFRFLSVLSAPAGLKVLVDGKELAGAEVTVDSRTQSPGLVVKLPEVAEGSAVTIELGPDPQLSRVDHSEEIHNILLDMQVDFSTKDKVWDIVDNQQQPVGVRLGRLLSLGLEEPLVGPVVELLVADSRSSSASAGLPTING